MQISGVLFKIPINHVSVIDNIYILYLYFSSEVKSVLIINHVSDNIYFIFLW